MGDRLGTLDAVGFLLFSLTFIQDFFWLLAKISSRFLEVLCQKWLTNLEEILENPVKHETNSIIRCKKVVFSQQHPVFPGGHPSKYWLDSTLLNFSDRTRTGVFNVIWPLAFEGLKFILFVLLLWNREKVEVCRVWFESFETCPDWLDSPNVSNVSLCWSKRALASNSHHKRQVFAPFHIGIWPIWAQRSHQSSFEAFSGPLNLVCQEWKPCRDWFEAWQATNDPAQVWKWWGSSPKVTQASLLGLLAKIKV